MLDELRKITKSAVMIREMVYRSDSNHGSAEHDAEMLSSLPQHR
jgi:hypothetical protein